VAEPRRRPPTSRPTRPSRPASPTRPARPATPRAASASRRVVRASGRRTHPRGSGLTGRAAVLGLVVCTLVLSLAYPAKQYLGQRGAIAHLAQDKAAAEGRVAVLTEQAKRLSDPAYLRSEARRRLQYVMPGDTVYVVITPDGARTTTPKAPGGPSAPASAGSWYSQLWGTVQAADQTP
jgi:cell division protein FtsB